MALEWVVLGYVAGAEAVMLLLLTFPGLSVIRNGLISVIQNLLRPFFSVVPFCLFLLMDIYWKYQTRPPCLSTHSCSPPEHEHHEKVMMKNERDVLLIVVAMSFYWFLYVTTNFVVRQEEFKYQIEKLKSSD